MPIEVVPGQADGHDGKRQHARAQALEVHDGSVQVRPVVEARTQHDLRVHLDAARDQRVELLDDVATALHPQRGHANFRLRGVDAHVQRREALLEDPVEAARTQVRQRDVTPVGEGQPEVVVLEEQGVACPRRVAVDEAERALVRALPDDIRRRHYAQRLPGRLLDLENGGFVVARAQDLDLDGRIDLAEAEVDRVADAISVDPDDAGADLELQLVGDSARQGFGDPDQEKSGQLGDVAAAAGAAAAPSLHGIRYGRRDG